MRLSIAALILFSFSQQLHAQAAATGIPYFQQGVKYTLNATFEDDPASPAISGTGTLEYTNNSPDTLHELYFHLYWNLFTSGSYGETAPNRDHDPDEKYGHGGIEIKGLSATDPNRVYEKVKVTFYDIDNTIMRVFLNEPLEPGHKVKVEFSWHGILPNYGIRSTWGWHDNGARNFSTAQWYPQVCVYDNHGWHADQYIGMGEFYTDYGSFDVSLTLPQRFTTVVTTGWSNRDNLDAAVAAKLDEAKAHPDSVFHIADHSEFAGKPIKKDEPTRTWKFHADSVRDFAWCADEAYIWDAVYSGGVMHHALYWQNSRDFWGREAAKIANITEQTNSAFAGKYIWPNMFMCETYEGGMEYPGVVYIGPYEDGTTFHWPQNTMMHELGHEWYPMMMGSNETDYGYMDEGFNTFITTFVMEKYFGRWNNSYGPGLGYNDDERTGNYRGAVMHQLSGNQEPSEQKADAFLSYRDYATATYPHTSSVFFMLRYVMGEHAFDDFMHLYYERWHMKHPYPDDLMNAAEDIERREGDTNRVRARGDLRWFFDEWFNKTWKLDYSIEDFDVDRVAGKGTIVGDQARFDANYSASVTISRKERAVMPLDLVFTFDDGTTEQRWIAVDDWLRTVASERTYTYTFAKHPCHVEINPSLELMDVNRLNNSSSWLPKFDVSLIPKVFGDVKPIDKYAVRSAPYVWPISADFSNGWVAGWTFLGSYLDRSDRLAIGLRKEIPNDRQRMLVMNDDQIMDRTLLSIQYHTVLDFLSPTSDLDLLANSDGRYAFMGLRYVHIVNEPGTNDPIHIIESGYDFSGYPWEKNTFLPVLNRGYLAYSMHLNGAWHELTLAGQGEDGLGDPRTTYTKLAGMALVKQRITGDWGANLRLFGGSMQPIDRALPAQTLFNISGPADVDHISDLYGSNFGSGVRDKIRNPAVGGPMVRGYFGANNMVGRVATSATFELENSSMFPLHYLREIPYLGMLFRPFGLVLFGDAGLVTDAFCTCNLREEIRSDAGLGLRFHGFPGRLDRMLDLDLERMNVQIDFPIYLDKPLTGEKKLGFRAVGMVRQEF